MSQYDTQRRAPGSKKELNAIERRGSERVPFSAVAHLLESHSQVRMTVRVADICRDGCYADTVSALSMGTKVTISIEHANAQLKTDATVTYSLQGMGMGLRFDELPPEMESILNRWIAEVRGEISPLPEAAEVNSAIQKYPRIERHILSRLISLMIRKAFLTQSEGTDLLNELLHED